METLLGERLFEGRVYLGSFRAHFTGIFFFFFFFFFCGEGGEGGEKHQNLWGMGEG